ncbi:hypothetical protein WJX74_010232 [Apatococcus lobatus]|uniref:Uncharacterized protein n=1 Tax=Apatococcus lobatus TaxID=904363 RepID=A0AAW1R4Y4_9CHLO
MAETEGPKCPQATAELLTHICQKGFQAGSLVGLGIVLPAVALRRRSSGASLVTKEFQTTGAKVLTYSAAIGLMTTGAMGLGMIYGRPLETEGIEDRAYRLRYNEGQLRTDLFGQEIINVIKQPS